MGDCGADGDAPRRARRLRPDHAARTAARPCADALLQSGDRPRGGADVAALAAHGLGAESERRAGKHACRAGRGLSARRGRGYLEVFFISLHPRGELSAAGQFSKPPGARRGAQRVAHEPRPCDDGGRRGLRPRRDRRGRGDGFSRPSRCDGGEDAPLSRAFLQLDRHAHARAPVTALYFHRGQRQLLRRAAHGRGLRRGDGGEEARRASACARGGDGFFIPLRRNARAVRDLLGPAARTGRGRLVRSAGERGHAHELSRPRAGRGAAPPLARALPRPSAAGRLLRSGELDGHDVRVSHAGAVPAARAREPYRRELPLLPLGAEAPRPARTALGHLRERLFLARRGGALPLQGPRRGRAGAAPRHGRGDGRLAVQQFSCACARSARRGQKPQTSRALRHARTLRLLRRDRLHALARSRGGRRARDDHDGAPRGHEPVRRRQRAVLRQHCAPPVRRRAHGGLSASALRADGRGRRGAAPFPQPRRAPAAACPPRGAAARRAGRKGLLPAVERRSLPLARRDGRKERGAGRARDQRRSSGRHGNNPPLRRKTDDPDAVGLYALGNGRGALPL